MRLHRTRRGLAFRHPRGSRPSIQVVGHSQSTSYTSDPFSVAVFGPGLLSDSRVRCWVCSGYNHWLQLRHSRTGKDHLGLGRSSSTAPDWAQAGRAPALFMSEGQELVILNYRGIRIGYRMRANLFTLIISIPFYQDGGDQDPLRGPSGPGPRV